MNSLKVDQRITLLRITDMAMSHRYEFTVKGVMEPQAVGYQGIQNRVAIVRQRGKRKDQYLDLKQDDILLDGWDQPFKTDTEACGIFSGNACYNLVGDPQAIKEAIEEKAIFPVTQDAKAKILIVKQDRGVGEDGELLYPEIQTRHAVINRMKGK